MILVTGGAGYVGSHYVRHETKRGRDLLVLDNLSRGHREAVGDARLVVGDVRDRALLDELFAQHPIEAVVHFAAYAYVGESMHKPAEYYDNNVVGTLSLLCAMRDAGVLVLVFSSSCATYGDPKYHPIDEEHPQQPVSPYGESKYFCERMMAAWSRAHGLRYGALRYFNAAGADPDGHVGESHEPETHLIANVLRVANGRDTEVKIFGDDYDTPDGTCVRDYVHVSDLAQAHALALDALRGGAASACYNLGGERGYSVREVIATCERVTGVSIRNSHAPRRPGDPSVLIASAARARRELGWAPDFGDLAKTIATAWRWERARRY